MFKLSNARTPLPEDEEEIVSSPLADEGETLDPPVEEDPAFSPLTADEAPNSVAMTAADIDSVRELILEMHPAIVPELIGGESIAALLASIAPAHQAYSKVISNVHIPAGGNPVIEFDPDSLSTNEKIRRGLTAYQRKG